MEIKKKSFKLSCDNFDEKFNLEIIIKPKNATQQERESVVSAMKVVTAASWFDFGEVTYKWFDLADIIFLVKKENDLVAFSANKFYDQSLIIFLSTMVLPKYQRIGLAKKLQKIAIQYFNKVQLNNFGFKYFSFINKLYFAYRTPNPKIVKAAKKFNLSLPIDNKKPTAKEVKIAKYVANVFSPSRHFDEEHFVIEEALKDKPGLIYRMEKIPWSGDSKVDEYCRTYLKYEEKKGNLLVIVGSLNIFQKIWLLLTI